MKNSQKVEVARCWRILSPAVLLGLLVVAHFTLRRNQLWLLLAASLAAASAGAVGIYLERRRFRSESSPESRYVTHALKHIALLTISIAVSIWSLLLLSGLIR